MRKRSRLVVLVLGVAMSMSAWMQNAGQTPQAAAASSIDYAGITELQQQLSSGRLGSQQLVHDFIRRIEALDQAGPAGQRGAAAESRCPVCRETARRRAQLRQTRRIVGYSRPAQGQHRYRRQDA